MIMGVVTVTESWLVSESRVAVAEARRYFGSQKKRNFHRCKPLPKD
jgi:hypothetical protein